MLGILLRGCTRRLRLCTTQCPFVASLAEFRIVRLIIYKQSGLGRRVRLMTRATIERLQDFCDVRRIHYVGNRMAFDRMTSPVLDGQNRHHAEVSVRQLHCAAENRHERFILHGCRIGVRTVALQAQSIRRLRTQQMKVLTAVRLMAGGATLHKGRLMNVSFLALLSLVSMTSQTYVDGVRLRQSRLAARMGTMAVSAIARRARMLNLGLLDQLALV